MLQEKKVSFGSCFQRIQWAGYSRDITEQRHVPGNLLNSWCSGSREQGPGDQIVTKTHVHDSHRPGSVLHWTPGHLSRHTLCYIIRHVTGYSFPTHGDIFKGNKSPYKGAMCRVHVYCDAIYAMNSARCLSTNEQEKNLWHGCTWNGVLHSHKLEPCHLEQNW